jgi:ribosomal-protein-alanine N-acetyltransferase
MRKQTTLPMRLPILTNRVTMRPFEPSDAEAAFAWFGAPVVMRFTPTGPDESLEHTEARLAKYQEHQAAHGFSKWIIMDRSSETPIGDAGLLVLDE